MSNEIVFSRDRFRHNAGPNQRGSLADIICKLTGLLKPSLINTVALRFTFFDILVQLIRTLCTSRKRYVWYVSLLLRQTYSVQTTAIS